MRVVLTSGMGLTGVFIRWYTWSDIAHAGIQLDDGTIIDATPSAGVSHHDTIAGSMAYYFDLRLPPEADLAAANQFLYAQIGKPYDWSAVYGMAFRRDWHDPHQWFCSELVQAWSEAGKFPLLVTPNDDRVSPRDLSMSPLLKWYKNIRSGA